MSEVIDNSGSHSLVQDLRCDLVSIERIETVLKITEQLRRKEMVVKH